MGGGFSANQIAEEFSVTRQTAQGIISDYRKRHPNNLYYDNSNKRQVKTNSFRPFYIQDRSDAFLDYLLGQSLVEQYMGNSPVNELLITDLNSILRRNLREQVVQSLILALQTQQTLAVLYQTNGSRIKREISPNHLFLTGNRYIMRGYCHNRRGYFDFHLTRMRSTDPTDTTWISDNNDDEWHRQCELTFVPNPDLPTDLQQAIASDYDMDEDGKLRILCREALSLHVEREMSEINHEYNMNKWVSV